MRALTDELAVTSSDGSLPDPETCGSNSLEDVIADLKYTGNFTRQDTGAPSIPPTTGAAD